MDGLACTQLQRINGKQSKVKNEAKATHLLFWKAVNWAWTPTGSLSPEGVAEGHLHHSLSFYYFELVDFISKEKGGSVAFSSGTYTCLSSEKNQCVLCPSWPVEWGPWHGHYLEHAKNMDWEKKVVSLCNMVPHQPVNKFTVPTLSLFFCAQCRLSGLHSN